MAFQDLLKKQMNGLGTELDELLKRLLPLNDPDLVGLFVVDADKKLVPHIHVTIEELVDMPTEQMRQILTGRDSEQMENLERLGDLFAALSHKKGLTAKGDYARKAVEVYQFITEHTATFSFTRSAKIAALKQS